jgi:nicotinamide mononucleotide transporter
MSNPLSVDSTFFRVLGYPMSYVEFVGTILYLLSVWLISRRNVLTWPIGIGSVILYMVLFYQIRLYSDALEQVYYLGASVYGWWYWSKSEPNKRTISNVKFSPAKAIMLWLLVTAALSVFLGAVMSHVHEWAPGWFPEPASYPYVDAATTILSLVAMWLMARKYIESWIYWIVVDITGIWLYFVKNVRFISLLYVILLGLAIRGLIDWTRARKAVAGTKVAEA